MINIISGKTTSYGTESYSSLYTGYVAGMMFKNFPGISSTERYIQSKSTYANGTIYGNTYSRLTSYQYSTYTDSYYVYNSTTWAGWTDITTITGASSFSITTTSQ